MIARQPTTKHPTLRTPHIAGKGAGGKPVVKHAHDGESGSDGPHDRDHVADDQVRAHQLTELGDRRGQNNPVAIGKRVQKRQVYVEGLIASIATAMPCPPPMHMVTRARFKPVRSSS